MYCAPYCLYHLPASILAWGDQPVGVASAATRTTIPRWLPTSKHCQCQLFLSEHQAKPEALLYGRRTLVTVTDGGRVLYLHYSSWTRPSPPPPLFLNSSGYTEPPYLSSFWAFISYPRRNQHILVFMHAAPSTVYKGLPWGNHSSVCYRHSVSEGGGERDGFWRLFKSRGTRSGAPVCDCLVHLLQHGL